MKKLFIFIISLSLLLLPGCKGGSYESGGEGLNIVTTVFPAFDFARELTGGKANVCLLVPPGSESHSYEPTAQDILRLQDCDLLIYNGGESESWLTGILHDLEGEVNAISMLEYVELLEEEKVEGMQSVAHEHGEEEEGHEGHGHDMEYDEHVWTSPKNAQLISQAILTELKELDTENAGYYAQRCESFCQKLQELDEGFRSIVNEADCRSLIFADRFPVRYFVEEYGLEYYAAFPGCAQQAEPSAKTVAFLIDKVRQEGTPAVLYIEFSNQKMADIICEDTGCKKLLFHSCHNVSRQQLDEGISYLELMENNLETLREALN